MDIHKLAIKLALSQYVTVEVDNLDLPTWEYYQKFPKQMPLCEHYEGVDPEFLIRQIKLVIWFMENVIEKELKDNDVPKKWLVTDGMETSGIFEVEGATVEKAAFAALSQLDYTLTENEN
jgi:hypothetical protein